VNLEVRIPQKPFHDMGHRTRGGAPYIPIGDSAEAVADGYDPLEIADPTGGSPDSGGAWKAKPGLPTLALHPLRILRPEQFSRFDLAAENARPSCGKLDRL
jgi:hypothetical protein